jgi:hypothetical protein
VADIAKLQRELDTARHHLAYAKALASVSVPIDIDANGEGNLADATQLFVATMIRHFGAQALITEYREKHPQANAKSNPNTVKELLHKVEHASKKQAEWTKAHYARAHAAATAAKAAAEKVAAAKVAAPSSRRRRTVH